MSLSLSTEASELLPPSSREGNREAVVGVAKIGCESMRIVQSKVEHRLILRLHNREDLYVLPSPHPQPASLTAPSERRP